MADKTRKKAKPEAETFPRKAIPCQSGPSDNEKGRAYASLINSPELAAYRVIGMMQPTEMADGIDTPTLLETLREQSEAVQGGDLTHAEAMLINQASALQALFVRLSERAMEQSHMPNLEGFMRMALRAQSQCRATLETLSAIKNPPIVYAKQANIAQGHQQVNNGQALDEGYPRTRENKNPPNKLLEEDHGERLDFGATRKASGADPAMATVGEVDRAEDK